MSAASDDETLFLGIVNKESLGGLLLIAATMLALVVANTPLNHYYQMLIDIPAGFVFADLSLVKPFLLWVNDGLMALFFLLVGLELKREFVQGELSDRANIVLPLFGAAGGMLLPSLIYLYFNYDQDATRSGWAIPAATDIAFALGLMSLLGSKVPTSLKLFLTSLAIFDDIGAIVIIAIFYTSNLSIYALIMAAICVVVLFFMNRNGVKDKSPYLFVGFIMWVSLLKSGVHATLSGVVLAMFIPMVGSKEGESPLISLEHDLQKLVTIIILPLFAFCNSGIDLGGISTAQVLHPVTLGIALGLFVGNQIGVFGFCWFAIKCNLAKLPKNCSWFSLYGVAILCGVGFTMSLFIGSLAFQASGNHFFDERLGIIIGSLISGIVGLLVLNLSLNKSRAEAA